MTVIDHEDPVISEYTVYVGEKQTDSSLLYLLQYTASSCAIIPNTYSEIQFKTEAQQIELTVPFNMKSAYYSQEDGGPGYGVNSEADFSHHGRAGLETSRLESYTLRGDVLPQCTVQYAVYRSSDDGAFYMFPLRGTIPLKPSLKYLNSNIASNMSLSTNSHGKADSDMKVVQMQFRKNETEEQHQARLNSYFYQCKKASKEPWYPLSYSVHLRKEIFGDMVRRVLDCLVRIKQEQSTIEEHSSSRQSDKAVHALGLYSAEQLDQYLKYACGLILPDNYKQIMRAS